MPLYENSGIEALGRPIADFVIVNQEFDDAQKRVGLDMQIVVNPVGYFFLNIVTKQHYVNESIEAMYDDIANPERLLAEQSDEESREPYVLNDAELTDEVIAKKFAGRIVDTDLLASMFFVAPIED